MLRRVLSICFVLAFLMISALFVSRPVVLALTATITPAPSATPNSGSADFLVSPASGSAPLTAQFTNHVGPSAVQICTWDFGDGPTQTFLASPGHTWPACPAVNHTYKYPGSYLNGLFVTGAFAVIKPGNVNVAGPTPTRIPTSTTPMPDLIIISINYVGSNPVCVNKPRVAVTVLNTTNSANGAAGPFSVSFGSQTQNVSGLASAERITLSFDLNSGGTITTVDPTNAVVELNEANNSWTPIFPISTQAATCTPTAPGGPTFTPTTTATATQGECCPPTLTATLTRTSTRIQPTGTGTGRSQTPPFPSRTWTPANGVSSTPTRTATRTFTPSPSAGVCSPVTSTILVPFVFDGAGTLCWQASSLGNFINSWNTTSVWVNGTNVTNIWVGSGSYPAKINGFYYVSYNSSGSFGHFEAKP